MQATPVSGIVGLLLAAGTSRRFGADKLLHPLTDGRCMAVTAADRLLPACDRLIAVVRSEQETLASLLSAAGCQIVHAVDADLGMGASLAAGVRASAEADGWVVALADMPFIKRQSHQAVVAQLRAGASLAATAFQGRRGHPVGFAKQWFVPLSAMTGDQGGRSILASYPDQLTLCPVDDPGVLRDIDHPADLTSEVATHS